MKNTLFQAETTIGVVDGKQEMLLSPCGVLMMVYLAWKDKPNPKTDRAIELYCRHLALHGYGVGARVWANGLLSQ